MNASPDAFSGSIPKYYDEFLGPLIFEEYGADLARRVSVPPNGSVLEIAAGTGIATRYLRDALPREVRIVVSDLSPAESAKQVTLGYVLGMPVCLQIAERRQPTVDQVMEIVERTLRQTYGEGAIEAKMQGIIFEARLNE